MTVVAIVTLVEDCKWCNHNNQTVKQSQIIVVQGWKSSSQLTNLNLKHFKTVEGINNYCIEARLSGITSIPNFMKIYQAF
jgi:hypothetical protein